jgi:transcriptional regulator with XRE-family HTH domain
MQRIGERIRKKRELLDLALNELAQRVGISSSGLSQIETAKAFPSILTLKSIAESLNTTVGELIGENESLTNNPVTLKSEARFVEKTASGAKIYLLSQHDANKQMDTYLVKFKKDSDLSSGLGGRNSQLFAYVISGNLVLNLNNKEHSLNIADSAYFFSRSDFQICNVGKSEAELLLIVSPPN